MTSSWSLKQQLVFLAQRRPGADRRRGAAGGARTRIGLPPRREFGDKLAKMFP
jgi:hypothetical protein